MTNWTTLPHQNLIAYQVARELVVIVREAKIADAKLAIRRCGLPRAHVSTSRKPLAV
jgi:3-dehydroquinate synthase class II